MGMNAKESKCKNMIFKVIGIMFIWLFGSCLGIAVAAQLNQKIEPAEMVKVVGMALIIFLLIWLGEYK